MKRIVILISVAILGAFLLAGCQTMKTKSIGVGLRSVDLVDDSGKVARSYFEMLDSASGAWYEAENVNGKWSLTPSGQAKKSSAAMGVGGGGGGGGGSC
jgi:predicted small secreted protein